MTLIRSISSKDIQLFLFKASMIGGNYYFSLVFNICVVTRANGVVGLFANVITNGKYGIMFFGWPWKKSK
jgi:hypothetical protein